MNPPKKKFGLEVPHIAQKDIILKTFKRLCIIDVILPNFITPKATPKRKKRNKREKTTLA
jgi:hypothetical protein